MLARAGAIVPLAPADDVGGGTDLPCARSRCGCIAGADGEFTLVEDRDDERWVRTRLTWDDTAGELTVHEAEGETSTLPSDRTYDVVVLAGEEDTSRLLFALLDRTRMPFVLKEATYDVVRSGAGPGPHRAGTAGTRAGARVARRAHRAAARRRLAAAPPYAVTQRSAGSARPSRLCL